jgi:hypothetical protein
VILILGWDSCFGKVGRDAFAAPGVPERPAGRESIETDPPTPVERRDQAEKIDTSNGCTPTKSRFAENAVAISFRVAYSYLV